MAFIGNTNTTQAFTPAVDYFSGNGSTTAFTLSRPVASVAQVQVTIDNVAQNPSSAFTVSGNTITFTSAPLSGTNNIYIYYTSPITQVIAPGQGTVNTTALGNITNIASGNSSLTLQTGSGNTTAVTIDTSQNVGIGTATPSSFYSEARNLVVGTGTGGQGMTIYAGTASQSRLMFADGTSGSDAYTGFVQYSHADNALQFGTNGGSERMRIDSSGNLLVGTTSSGSGNSARVLARQTSSGGYAVVADAVSNGGTYYLVGFQINGTTVVGQITSNGTTTSYTTSSDYRLKNTIAPMTGALAKVALLKPCTYKWNADGSDGEGFIAHELAEVCPHAVSGEKDAVDAEGNPQYQGIDTSFLVATLTAAIQELKAINDIQAETINALTARIVALENR